MSPFDPETAREAAYKSHEARRNGKSEDDPEAILEKMSRTASSERVRMDAARALLSLRAKQRVEEKADDVDPDAWMLKLSTEERATVHEMIASALLRDVRPEDPDDRAHLEKMRAHHRQMQQSYVKKLRELPPE